MNVIKDIQVSQQGRLLEDKTHFCATQVGQFILLERRQIHSRRR